MYIRPGKSAKNEEIWLREFAKVYFEKISEYVNPVLFSHPKQV